MMRSSKAVTPSVRAWVREGIQFTANERRTSEWWKWLLNGHSKPHRSWGQTDADRRENISFVLQESSFPIKMRILKTRILDTKYLFAFCKDKVYSKHQKFSELSKTPAPPGCSKQEHVTLHLNLRALKPWAQVGWYSEIKSKSKHQEFSNSLRVQSETTYFYPSWVSGSPL